MFPILKERTEQRAGTLSGGEQQMLAIGRGLMARPKMLLFDEPSMGLAPRVMDEIFTAIGEFRKHGTDRAAGRAKRPLGAAHRRPRLCDWKPAASSWKAPPTNCWITVKCSAPTWAKDIGKCGSKAIL